MYTLAFVYILLKIIHLEIRNSKPAHSFKVLIILIQEFRQTINKGFRQMFVKSKKILGKKSTGSS